MRFFAGFLAFLVAAASGAAAEGERAGAFDYYVLALSWNATWCERVGDGRGADQCDPRHDHGFTLHGLWPQTERGWPSFCRTSESDPSRTATRAMADIMGSGGLAWHQWKKHGRCSGLSAADYFALSRKAYDAIARPEIFRRLPNDMTLSPMVVEEAFLDANSALESDGVTIACRDGYLQEVRICLTKDLTPRACGPDIRRDCAASAVDMPQMR